MRLTAVKLLTTVFLRTLLKLATLPDFHLLWLQVLRFLEKYLKTSAQQAVLPPVGGPPPGPDSTAAAATLGAAIPLALKQILLAMSSADILRPATPGAGGAGEDGSSDEVTGDEGLWDLTWAVVESFCPGMRESMFGNANVAVTGVAEALTTASEEQEQQQQQQTEGDHGDEVSV